MRCERKTGLLLLLRPEMAGMPMAIFARHRDKTSIPIALVNLLTGNLNGPRYCGGSTADAMA